MTWKSKKGSDFQGTYDHNSAQQELFDFAIALILESNDPMTLPLTIKCPNAQTKGMINLQNTHAIIFRKDDSTQIIEFIFCN